MVEINITVDELQTLRHQSISNLLYPLQTVLDDGIGRDRFMNNIRFLALRLVYFNLITGFHVMF